MSNPTETAEVQEEDMFGRITNRIDALVNGNANFEHLKESIQTALEITDEISPDAMVARIVGTHKDAKLYEKAHETLRTQDNLLSITAETIAALGEDVARERKRADDLQAEKELIAGLLGLIEEEPEPGPPVDPAPDEPLVEHAADDADHDDNEDPGHEGSGE